MAKPDKRVSNLELLRERGLRPKKSFGQNFLQDPAICDRIAALAASGGVRTVIEIGAGLGALTAPLAECDLQVVAIERDRDLVPILRERFAGVSTVSILEADAVRVDWPELLAGEQGPVAIAGNLPYQLTGRLVRRVVENARAIAHAVLMVQREVADRLVAAPATPSYGALSVFVQAAFDVERAMNVAAGAFAPAPRVGSAVVVLTPAMHAEETPRFRELVQRAFGARRKKLSNAWRGLASREAVAAAATEAGIDLDARGETLSVEQFAAMAQALERAT
jgi:16S rRNA (adenine1518-N6/adenine1519-N6)-dimethyltransferase